MAKKPNRTWALVLSLGIPLGVVGLSAMMITFATLIDVARVNGLPFPQLFPIVVDVGMVGTMIAAAQFRLRGINGRGLAYPAFIVLSLVSVIANATHAQQAANLSQTTVWAATLIGAVPPATLLVMTHLVMLLIPDEKERARLQAQREKTQAQTDHVATVARATAVSAPPVQPPARPASPPMSVDGGAEVLRLVSKHAPVSADRDTVIGMVQEYIEAEGKKPTGALVGEWLGGKSAKTGQRFLKEIEAELDAESGMSAVDVRMQAGEERSR